MEEGSFVSIDFVGRVKDTREIFDLTREDVAKNEKIYDPKIKYGTVTVIVGANLILKGLDNVLREMKVGEKRTVEIEPKDAFGERSPDLIKPIPLANFKEKNIDPNPGSFVNINGVNGRIVSIDGGRIKVDFNHPLAGKKIEYEVEIKEQVNETDKKVKSVVIYFSGADEKDFEIVLNGKVVEIVLKEKLDVHKNVKQNIATTILKWIKEIDNVKFIETFSK